MSANCGWIDRLRQPKIFNMSIFDWVTSLLAAALVGKYWGIQGTQSWLIFLLGWILLGVVVHLLVGVPTMLGYYLGLNRKPERRSCA